MEIIFFFIPLFSVTQPTTVLESSEHPLDPLAAGLVALWGRRHCGRTCRSLTRQPRGGRRFKPCSPAWQSPGLATNTIFKSVLRFSKIIVLVWLGAKKVHSLKRTALALVPSSNSLALISDLWWASASWQWPSRALDLASFVAFGTD